MRITIKLEEQDIEEMIREYIEKRGCVYVSHHIAFDATLSHNMIEVDAQLSNPHAVPAPLPVSAAKAPSPRAAEEKEEPVLSLGELTRPTEEGVDQEVPRMNRPTVDDELARILMENERILAENSK